MNVFSFWMYIYYYYNKSLQGLTYSEFGGKLRYLIVGSTAFFIRSFVLGPTLSYKVSIDQLFFSSDPATVRESRTGI